MKKRGEEQTAKKIESNLKYNLFFIRRYRIKSNEISFLINSELGELNRVLNRRFRENISR